jgi:hypothetical protein
MLSRYRKLFVALVVISYLALFAFQVLAVMLQPPYRDPRIMQFTAIFATNTAVQRALNATDTAQAHRIDSTNTARAATTQRPTSATKTGDASQ